MLLYKSMQVTLQYGQPLGVLFGKTYMTTYSYLLLSCLYLLQFPNYGSLILKLGMLIILHF